MRVPGPTQNLAVFVAPKFTAGLFPFHGGEDFTLRRDQHGPDILLHPPIPPDIDMFLGFPRIPEVIACHNVSGQYDFGTLQLRAGVTNITDEEPPLLGGEGGPRGAVGEARVGAEGLDREEGAREVDRLRLALEETARRRGLGEGRERGGGEKGGEDEADGFHRALPERPFTAPSGTPISYRIH